MALLDLCLSSSPVAQDETSLTALDSAVGQAEQPSSTAPAQGLKRRKAQMSGSLPLAKVPVKDGYHWLKYGEKLLRDRRTLRHYYRCGQRAETGCPAKKMVDVLVPTGACHCLYRDAHNHPSPPTTTAASSTPGPVPPLQLRAPVAPFPGPLPGLPAPPLDLNASPDASAFVAAAASMFTAATLAPLNQFVGAHSDAQTLLAPAPLPPSIEHLLSQRQSSTAPSLVTAHSVQSHRSTLPYGLPASASASASASAPAIASASPSANVPALPALSSAACPLQQQQQRQLSANLAACMSLLSGKQQISRNQSPQGPLPDHYGHSSQGASDHGQASQTLGSGVRPSVASPRGSTGHKGACPGSAYAESAFSAPKTTQSADSERRLQQHLVDLKHWLLVPRVCPAAVSPDAALSSCSGISLGLQKIPRTGNSPGIRRRMSSAFGNLDNLRATVSSPLKRLRLEEVAEAARGNAPAVSSIQPVQASQSQSLGSHTDDKNAFCFSGPGTPVSQEVEGTVESNREEMIGNANSNQMLGMAKAGETILFTERKSGKCTCLSLGLTSMRCSCLVLP